MSKPLLYGNTRLQEPDEPAILIVPEGQSVLLTGYSVKAVKPDDGDLGIVIITVERLIAGSPHAKLFNAPAYIRGRTRAAMKRIWEAAFPMVWQTLTTHTMNPQSGLSMEYPPNQSVIIDRAVRITGVPSHYVVFHTSPPQDYHND